MQQCGFCLKVYDESEYTRCPNCSNGKGKKEYNRFNVNTNSTKSESKSPSKKKRV